jgi:hypothetical protein
LPDETLCVWLRRDAAPGSRRSAVCLAPRPPRGWHGVCHAPPGDRLTDLKVTRMNIDGILIAASTPERARLLIEQLASAG